MKEGITRNYCASKFLWDTSLPTIRVMEKRPEDHRGIHNEQPRTISIGRGDRCFFGDERLEEGRKMAADMLRKWRANGWEIIRSRIEGSHFISTLKHCDTVGWNNRSWK